MGSSDEQLRLVRHRHRQRDLGPHTFRERLDPAVERQFEALDQPLVFRQIAARIKAGGEPADFAHRHPVVQCRPVGDIADPAANLLPEPAAVEPQNLDVPGIRLGEPQQDPESRRLAGSVLSQQSDHGAAWTVETHSIQSDLAFETFADILKPKRRTHALLSPR